MKKILVATLFLFVSLPLLSNTLDQELDKYWGAKRKIVVIQKKEYTKKDKMELTFYGGMVVNDAFYNSFPLGMRFNWFTSEFLSFGASGSYRINSDTGTISVLEAQGVKAKFTEQVDWDFSLDMTYSFLYGKVAFSKTTLTYFDIYTLLFASLYGTEYYQEGQWETPNSSLRYGGGIGFGMRFFLAQSITFKLESRQGIFLRTPSKSDGTGGKGGMQKTLDVTVGIGWLF